MQNVHVAEEGDVVEEGLRRHHGEAEQQPMPVLLKYNLPHLDQRRPALADVQGGVVRDWLGNEGRSADRRRVLDLVNDLTGRPESTLGHQPARTLRDPTD